jgi:hypothetical protein
LAEVSIGLSGGEKDKPEVSDAEAAEAVEHDLVAISALVEAIPITSAKFGRVSFLCQNGTLFVVDENRQIAS